MGIGTRWGFRRRPVSQLFYDFGIHCATHQIRVILICGFVITSLFYPALAIYFSHQPLSHFSTRILDSLFLPSANDAFHHNDLHDFWQGYDALKIRTDAAARARCGTEHTVRVERLFIPSTIPDPFGALNLQTLLPTLNLLTTLENHLTPELPCVRLLENTSPATPPSHKCLVISPTAHWSDDANIIATDPHLYTSLNKAHRNVSRGGIPLTAEMALAGRLTTDHAGYGSIIESSKFLSVSFFFREDDCHANVGHDAWRKLVESSVPDGAEVVPSGDQPKLLALEFAALPKSYSPWVSVGLYVVYIIIFIQLSGSMRRMDSVHSRFGLTFTGMVEILASTITSVSVCAIAGFRVTMVPWSILPIVIVIVGAENMFVLMEAVLATSISLPIRRRIAEGLQKAGVSITLKLITYNAVLGTIAYFSSGAIRQFCVFVIVVLVAHWFLIHTFFLAVLSIDLQRLEQLSDVLRQGSSSPRSASNAPDQRRSRTRFGIRQIFKTKAARNVSLMLVLAITGGLYYYSGPLASSRVVESSNNAFETERQTMHHLTPTQSVSTPHTAPYHPSSHVPHEPTTPALPSTSVIIWRTLNPPNDPLVHIRIEPPVLVLFPQPTDARESQAKPMGWSYRMRRLRPVLWTLKVLILPIAATLAGLYGILLHLLRNAELRAAQRDRIDSLIEGDAEEHEREREREREREEQEKKIAGTFTTLPRGSKSDLGKIQASRDGKVVAAVSVEGVVLIWSDATKAGISRPASPGRMGQVNGPGSNGSKSARSPPIVIPVPVAGMRATSLAIDSKGRRLAVAGGGVIQIWDISQGAPVLGRRLLQSTGDTVRELKFLKSKQSEHFGAFPSSFTSTQPSPKHTLLAAYEDGTVLEWDCDSGVVLARIVPRYPQSRASLFVRETFVAIAFSNPDGHIDVYRRHLDNDRVASYTPVMSPKVSGVVAIDVHEWSLGILLATLTSTGHAAVWGTNIAPIVEMDVSLTLHNEDSSVPEASPNGGRIVLLPAPPAPPPCRQCGLPPPCTFTVAFALPSALNSPANHNPTVYIRRASVLYQPGRCSCQPISIASTLAGPRVISFGFPSGVRVVSGLGIGGVNGGTAVNEFPVSIHGLRRASSSYGRHSFESSSSTGTEDLTPDASKDYSGFLAPPATNGASTENGHNHSPKHVVGSDVRWEQHTIEESCENGQWEIVGTRVVGIRRKSRAHKPGSESGVSGSSIIATKHENLPNSVLERWEVWQVDTATTELPRGTSTLSRLCEGHEATPARTSRQSGESPDSRHSPHISRILRLGRAAEAQLPSSPLLSGGHSSIDPRDLSYPRLPFTRIYSTNASYDRLFTALGNTIGVLRLDHPTSSGR
ncbi:Patched family, partial [Rhizoctonia solani]